MQKTMTALALAGLTFAAAAATTEAAPFMPLPKTAIESLHSNVTDASWVRCWRNRWGRRVCQRCWRDRWGRVCCS